MCGIFAYAGHELTTAVLADAFKSVEARGPDFSTMVSVHDQASLGFHRLAIMDPTPAGNQPFHADDSSLVCNGEIYNYQALAEAYDISLTTGSDCEVILPLFRKLGIAQTCALLDGVFGFAIVDGDRMYIGRDPIGIRALFIGTRKTADGRMERLICSEMKGIHALCDDVMPFPPGHYAVIDLRTQQIETQPYYTYDYPVSDDLDEAQVMDKLRSALIAGVDKRMMSDRPIGCLVSGGVDSSLVAALVAKHFPRNTLHTFTVGLDCGSSDRGFAKMVADHIGSIHHEVMISKTEALELLKETVRVTETFDTTTIRASTMQLAVARYIQKETDIKVVFNGDVIDEASGSYVYFKNAPSEDAYQDESVRLMREIHLYDVLRTDRTISGCGLEARLPFGDLNFLNYYMAIAPALRKPRNGVEKYLLRKAFDGVIPDAVLWRPKEAFSDGCSAPTESWYAIIQAFVEQEISDAEFAEAHYEHCPPRTKEELYYRKIFETHYPGRATVIPRFWMPRWCGDDVIDPSARVLADVYRPASADESSAARQELSTDQPQPQQSLKGTG
ncbi:MAG: asparagine synthase-related protein [Myxococcota bacterium]|nr:asparagine synthase-related protein [Myxococcota bacterium]